MRTSTAEPAARGALLLGGCAILVLFGWVMLRMARLVTRPVHTLSEAVKRVEGGDFDTARAMLPAVPSADEIGTLTRDVDTMLG
ncbi:HAMP domain-containing protein [Gemmiger sp.]|jgi:HAMP domain-containing protein|uniref:HAMP domain-containing protein n=1 Tax=Gemmiger sp. TaxID=2049027 RepID=UPI002943A836|nr:HAMP domain-containing protein [uncultured Gemmiger sp.]